MAINKGEIAFIGARDGICGYMSHGINIIRKSTPLEGPRVKKDPAFKGFRKSSSRMKEASPVAAALYNQIPKEQKKYSLYRLLTGEALKLLKGGMDKAEITEKLQKLYIDPIIQEPIKLQSPEGITNTNPKAPHKRIFIIHRPTVRYQIRNSFRKEGYLSRSMSIGSPSNNGLPMDIVAYG